MSNRCQGLPSGVCPENRCDRTVKFGIYDLFLCSSCEKTRDAERSTELKEVSSKKHTKQQTKKPAGGNTASSSAVASSQPESTSSVASASGLSTSIHPVPEPELIIDELLSYVCYYRDKCSVESLRRTVLSFYLPGDICQSKKVLIGQFSSQLGSCASTAERRNSAARASHEAEIDDIVSLCDVLDLQGCFAKCQFVARNLDNLPKFGPEELNLAAVVERQVRTEANVTDMAAAIDQLKTINVTSNIDLAGIDATSRQVNELQQKLESFSSLVCARLDHLNAVCSSSLSTASSTHQQHEARQSDSVDRKLNIVMFGVKEDRDVSVWHKSVNDVLSFVSGHAVDVVDLFRLGRYVGNNNGSPRKPRPILIKLRTFWDKRVLMSRCSVLKQYQHAGVFIVPDESPEVRRKNTFDRLKYRAQSEGKKVVVIDGVLSVDDIAVFSLQSGYINNVHHG